MEREIELGETEDDAEGMMEIRGNTNTGKTNQGNQLFINKKN